MQRYATCLWFDDQAEAAVRFYADTLPECQVIDTVHTTDAGPGPAGKVLVIIFELGGQRYTALNGGPQFRLTEAVSIEAQADSQEESDRIYDAFLAAGAQEQQCGWLKDQFGMCWQVFPARLYELLADPDPARANAGTAAMYQQKRIVLADIEAAMDAARR